MSVKIYAVRNETSDLTYVGRTTLPLSVRLRLHKSNPNKCSCRMMLNDPTIYIELLEECEVDAGKERERWWIRNTPNCVNQIKLQTAEEKKQGHAEAARRYREKRKSNPKLEPIKFAREIVTA